MQFHNAVAVMQFQNAVLKCCSTEKLKLGRPEVPLNTELPTPWKLPVLLSFAEITTAKRVLFTTAPEMRCMALQ
jgi:hypothetical protein